ncbi:unnamed protein product [Brassica rapa]|uniref:Uncharacterized protein n=1 Tax=Brassica campestris TaxID=3711 RepID=A0A3P5YBD4_BRACM|nr:unnamed protein product [Brassica rapa]VDC64992.1 unnamed protein product [Brassica rapa]
MSFGYRENVHCSKILLCFEFLGFAYKLKVYVLTLDLECDFLIDLSNKHFLFASVFDFGVEQAELQPKSLFCLDWKKTCKEAICLHTQKNL